MRYESYREQEQMPPRRAGHHDRHDRRSDASGWHWLLFLPIALALLVPLYNRLGPTLFGVPFFYWWQMGLAGLSAAVITIVFLATKDRT